MAANGRIADFQLPNGNAGTFAYAAGMAALRAVIFDLDETLTDRALSIERFAPFFAAKFQSALGAAELGQIVRCIREADGNGYASREELCAHIQSALPWKERPE